MYVLILYLPLVSFFICLFLGRYIGMNGSKIISNICLSLSLFLSFLIFVEWNFGINLSINLTTWFNVGVLSVPLTIYFDHISLATTLWVYRFILEAKLI